MASRSKIHKIKALKKFFEFGKYSNHLQPELRFTVGSSKHNTEIRQELTIKANHAIELDDDILYTTKPTETLSRVCIALGLPGPRWVPVPSPSHLKDIYKAHYFVMYV